jgi:hypothetical protein
MAITSTEGLFVYFRFMDGRGFILKIEIIKRTENRGNVVMYKKIAITGFAIALTAGVVLATANTGAEAGGWNHRNGWAAAGGFAAGALVGSALSQPRYYVEPAPRYEPAPVYYDRPEPWTPAWYRYCSAKYRSFDPQSGYFRTYSGRARFCR